MKIITLCLATVFAGLAAGSALAAEGKLNFIGKVVNARERLLQARRGERQRGHRRQYGRYSAVETEKQSVWDRAGGRHRHSR